MNDITEVLALLRPYDPIGVEKVRIGARGDCGYVMLDRFRPGQTLFSFGVGHDTSFDADLVGRGVRAHLFDHTIEDLPDPKLKAFLHRVGLAECFDANMPGATLATHVARYAPSDTAADMLLKIDVEGYEWGALDAAPDCMLAQFEQIVVEFHRLHMIAAPHCGELIQRALHKLDRGFVPFHVHSHNQFDHKMVAGLPVPQLLEVSYARRGLCGFVPSRMRFPTPLDFPCNPNMPEHRLWMWPFLPESVTTA